MAAGADRQGWDDPAVLATAMVRPARRGTRLGPGEKGCWRGGERPRSPRAVGWLEAPPITAAEEVAAFDQDLAPGFRRLPAATACTAYHDGKGQALDYVIASVGMQEVMRTAHVMGYCAVAACADLAGAMPAAYERLSDHCRMLVDLQDADRE